MLAHPEFSWSASRSPRSSSAPPWIPNGDSNVDDDGDGYTEDAGDCDDVDKHVNPGMAEDDCFGPSIGVDNDCDGTVDEDCVDEDTAIGLLSYVGDATVCDGPTFLQGHFGYQLDSLDGDVVCVALSEWTSDGTAPRSACPGCDWAFNLTAENGVGAGAACEGIGLTGDIWDGFTGGFGFAEEYTYTYNGTPYVFDTAVLYYSTMYHYWFPLAYNYGAYGYNSGDATHVEFRRAYNYLYYTP